MTSQRPEQMPDDDIPEAVVTARSGISIVWLIPIVAALIGGWIAYKAFSEAGPTITIVFDTADGSSPARPRSSTRMSMSVWLKRWHSMKI